MSQHFFPSFTLVLKSMGFWLLMQLTQTKEVPRFVLWEKIPHLIDYCIVFYNKPKSSKNPWPFVQGTSVMTSLVFNQKGLISAALYI